jgi:hypothetical protein
LESVWFGLGCFVICCCRCKEGCSCFGACKGEGACTLSQGGGGWCLLAARRGDGARIGLALWRGGSGTVEPGERVTAWVFDECVPREGPGEHCCTVCTAVGVCEDGCTSRGFGGVCTWLAGDIDVTWNACSGGSHTGPVREGVAGHLEGAWPLVWLTSLLVKGLLLGCVCVGEIHVAAGTDRVLPQTV